MLAKTPRVSVIVITYNQAAYLSQAVDSIASQRVGFDFEIVISEDCSTDGTRKVALELQQHYPGMVRVILPPHNYGSTRNFRLATQVSRGRYLAICEGDDFWIDPDKMARQAAALDDLEGVDLAFTSGFCECQDRSREYRWDWGPEARIIAPDDLFRSATWIAPTASLMWRSGVTSDFPDWYDEQNVGDLFLLMAGSARGGAYYDPIPSVCYRVGHTNRYTARREKADRAELARHIRQIIHSIEDACAYYGLPRTIMSDRLQDCRLQLLSCELAERRFLAAIRALANVEPQFVLRKLFGRLTGRRSLSR